MIFKKCTAVLVMIVAIITIFAGCGGSRPSGETAVTETLQESAGEERPARVAAVSRSLAELWLLAGGELAGVTEDASDLPGLTEETAVIGTVSKPGIEAILALDPDLVILSAELTAQQELREELELAGVACMPIEINGFDDYRTVMATLTDMTGREDLFEKNVTGVGEEIQNILGGASARIAENEAEERTFLAMRVSATKNKTLKKDYFACEIFSDFGLKNIAEDNSALDELNLEAVIAADPDYIFVIPQGKENEAQQSYREAFADHAVWGELRAVKSGRVFILPKDLFQYKPNARWGEAYGYIDELLQK